MKRETTFSKFGKLLEDKVTALREETSISWRVCSILSPTAKSDIFITMMNNKRESQLAILIYYANGSWSELHIYNTEIQPEPEL